ncbi:ead/Ea22-like family protein [Enterobacter hormaechei]|uniref:ead/Ea22-like family protein n=1 Tax=Enterobacter hormaechei TaxID=158836 RepID=UPI0013EF7963|nr:ead/Ea22-like family protein [Enterobacter hormaechei]KAF6704500.1 ead/Ea22-like family protein [Enterobacter hormaechei]KAF6712369.1 ead/Ea22-like family protein [Enterobacter hormaechei]
MSNIDKQSLRTAAENATPGEWCTDDYHGVIADAGLNANYYIASCSGPDNRSNKRFIAAANPATVLALLDELEALKLANAAQDDHINQQQDRIDLLEKGNNEAARQINSWRRLAKQNIAEREKDVSELNIARKRIAELEAREVVLPQRYSMLHRVDFDEPYHTEMVYKQHQVLEALHDAGVNVAAAAKGEAS